LLSDCEGVRLVAVADAAASARQRARDLQVPVFPSLDALLEHTPPDYLILATPVQGRVELVERAVAQPGVRAILVEKPWALTLSDADRMAAACDSCGVILALGHHWRYCRDLCLLKEAVQTGALGAVECWRGVSYGNLLDQGDHLLDAILWITGDERAVWAMSQACDDAAALDRLLIAGEHCAKDVQHPAPMWMTHHLALTNGARVVLETGPLFQPSGHTVDHWHERRIVAVGSEGMAECRPGHFVRWVTSRDGTRHEVSSSDSLSQATRRMHEDICESVRRGGVPLCAAQDSRRALEGLLLCGRSARSGGLAAAPVRPEESPFLEPDASPTSQAASSSNTVGVSGGRSPSIRFSVIVPLVEDRDMAAACLSQWVNCQSLARGDYEVLVVSDGATPELEREIQSLLGPSDRLLREDKANRSRLYDLGARAASGEFLFFTESHCLPEPDCLLELDRFLAAHGVDGACCRSIGVAKRWLDRQDHEMFEEGFRLFRQGEDWRKVNVHGFALRRQRYLEVGGLAHRYGGFAEMMLAAALRDRGVQLGYAAAAAVHHKYHASFRDTLQLIDFFVTGESLYRAEHPGPDRIGYSFLAGVMQHLPSDQFRLWRSVTKAVGRDFLRRAWWRGDVSAWKAVWQSLSRSLGPGWAGGAWERSCARLALCAARCRYWLWAWHPVRRGLAYRRWIYQAHRWSRVQFLARHRAAPLGQASAIGRASWAKRMLVSELAENQCAGFHRVEKHRGRPFRWTERAAALQVAIPQGEYEVRLETNDLRRSRRLNLKVFFNGRRIKPGEVVFEDGVIRFSLRADQFNPKAAQTLVFTCRPVRPWKRGLADFRELGLPVFAIQFTPRVERDQHTALPSRNSMKLTRRGQVERTTSEPLHTSLSTGVRPAG
jgi:predicted dehydrogenase/glycosyltransferase involved in cell wall biosynthesis